MRIQLLSHCHHLSHLFGCHDSVASLPEENTWVITIEDHCSTHYFNTLVPLTTSHQTFLVACRTNLNNSKSVTCLNINLLWCDVHPANIVGIALTQHPECEVVHPVGVSATQARPVVGRSLGIASEPDKPTVKPDTTSSNTPFEFGITESSQGFTNINNFTVDADHCINFVEIRIVNIPKPCVFQRA